jgi:hypothetical protein
MALIPLKQTITHIPKGIEDPDNGRYSDGIPVTLKCRLVEGMKRVQGVKGSKAVNEPEVLSIATIYFEGLLAITLDDRFEFIDEIGTERTYYPINYEIIRDISGKSLFTVVRV